MLRICDITVNLPDGEDEELKIKTPILWSFAGAAWLDATLAQYPKADSFVIIMVRSKS